MKKIYLLTISIVFFFIFKNEINSQTPADSASQRNIKFSAYLFGTKIKGSETAYKFSSQRIGCRATFMHKKLSYLFAFVDIAHEKYSEEDYSKPNFTTFYNNEQILCIFGVGVRAYIPFKKGFGSQIEITMNTQDRVVPDACLKFSWMNKSGKFFVGSGLLVKPFVPNVANPLLYIGSNF